jgi:hypothetical protein
VDADEGVEQARDIHLGALAMQQVANLDVSLEGATQRLVAQLRDASHFVAAVVRLAVSVEHHGRLPARNLPSQLHHFSIFLLQHFDFDKQKCTMKS